MGEGGGLRTLSGCDESKAELESTLFGQVLVVGVRFDTPIHPGKELYPHPEIIWLRDILLSGYPGTYTVVEFGIPASVYTQTSTLAEFAGCDTGMEIDDSSIIEWYYRQQLCCV